MRRQSEPKNISPDQSPAVDWFVFVVGSALLLAVVLPIVIAPEWSGAAIDRARAFLTSEFGIVYIVLACLVFFFLLALAIGPSGRLVLGPPGQLPAHSRFSWVAMLFCTGIGASLVYWAATEWVYYYEQPPFSVEPRSDQAIVWAASYGIFHWGPLAWSLYCLPAVAFCLSYHHSSCRAICICRQTRGRYRLNTRNPHVHIRHHGIEGQSIQRQRDDSNQR
jgi:BCCT family betaine/carnitine transporter